MPVRVGVPHGVSGLSEVVGNQIHATGVGLLLYGAQAQRQPVRRSAPSKLGSWWQRIRTWIDGEF